MLLNTILSTETETKKISIVSETMREHRKKYDVKKFELKYNTKFYGKIKTRKKMLYLNVQ